MAPRIIFLDIERVLNSEMWEAHGQRQSSESAPCKRIDPAAVGLLNQLVDRSGAQVVVAAGWRTGGLHYVRSVLAQRGFIGQVVGITPILDAIGVEPHDRTRVRELEAWLVLQPFNAERHIVILDSHHIEIDELRRYLVRTTSERGLERKHVEAALRVLATPFDWNR